MTRKDPSANRAWLVVAMLCLIAAFSYLDRYVIALLAVPIMADLAIGSTDIGLLIGLGFGLVYSIAGLPIAYLLDRGARVRIVGLGVILWSLCTVAGAFADTYVLLLASRVGVAIGEAVLVPAAVSLIADLFSPTRRSLPVAIFMAVATLMGSGAFLVGGQAFALATAWSDIAAMEPWRLTLVIVGAPGAVLGLVWLALTREPARAAALADEVAGVTIAAAATAVRRDWLFFLPFLLALGVSAIGSYSFISWSSTMLVASFGMTVGAAGSLYGGAGLAAGVAAAVFWPTISGWLVQRGRAAANMPLLAGGLALAHAALVAFSLVANLPLMLLAISVASFGFAASGALAVLIIQSATAPRMRAKVTSLYVLSGNLIGLVCGPPLTAWVSERVFSGPDAMRFALAAVGAALLPVTFALLAAGSLGYRRALLSFPDPRETG